MDPLLEQYLTEKNRKQNIFEGLKLYVNHIRYCKEVVVKEGVNRYDGVLIEFYTNKHKQVLDQLKELERELNTMSYEHYRATHTVSGEKF